MKEKLAPILAVAAAACAGQQVTKSPEPKVEETQCETLKEALKTIGAEKDGLQPDGTFVYCETSEHDTTHPSHQDPSHLVLREAELGAMRGAVEKVCRDVAEARGCSTGEPTLSQNRMRVLDVDIKCPDSSQNSVCNADVKTTGHGHCVTTRGTNVFCIRAQADPDMVLENPLQPTAVEVE